MYVPPPRCWLAPAAVPAVARATASAAPASAIHLERIHWASFVEEAGKTPHLFLRAPREKRIPPPWVEKPTLGVDRRRCERLRRGVCATEILALVVPVALATARLTRRRPPARGDSAEVLRWWGLARGLSDPRRATGVMPAPGAVVRSARPSCSAVKAYGADADADSEPLSAAIPSHAITLQGSALFRTGDRQRVLAAVEGKLDETLRAHRAADDLRAARREQQRLALGLRPDDRRDGRRDAARARAAATQADIRRRCAHRPTRRLRSPDARIRRARRALRRPHRRGV